jgi:hypothetical protein
VFNPKIYEMKNYLIVLIGALIVSLSITSCANSKHMNEMHLSQEEVNKFSVKGDTIYYNFKEVAIVQSVEWEYIPGEEDMRMEISLKQTRIYEDGLTKKLIKYVHTRYPEAKIEVNFDE